MHQTIDHRAALHVPLFQQLVSKHPADAWCRVTRGHTGQQHAGISRLGHRHRLHQEFQLPLLASFLDVKGEKKRGSGLRLRLSKEFLGRIKNSRVGIVFIFQSRFHLELLSSVLFVLLIRKKGQTNSKLQPATGIPASPAVS